MTQAPQGTMIPQGTTGTVRMEDRYDTDIHDLWSALTEPDRLARWIAVVTGDLRLGGVLQASFTSRWEGTLRVEVCDAPHHLRLHATSLDDADEEYDTYMEARLTEDGDGTLLVIEDSGLPIDELYYHGAGWQVHLQDLDDVLAGRPTSEWEPRWRALIPEYRERAEAFTPATPS